MAARRPRVLVTRAAHQGSELAEHLRALGADPVLIPAIETADPTSFSTLDAALADLNHFHWLLFTSSNAVEAFARRSATYPPPATYLSTPGLPTSGPPTARHLDRSGQLHRPRSGETCSSNARAEGAS